ncbi:hypothetical protein SAMN04487996_12283 [Dyadobacter soli]|uniref:Uncharacterized protein n=1 Tax=Dyadobacter soli TaxID=659014 RepID=A0A1G7WMR5_9BACT|nr:hypothetical protein [Dyadobacter soli]SDG72510.1 hypothetical protein SAMN04487996_12283 [Dyadobacter soli]
MSKRTEPTLFPELPNPQYELNVKQVKLFKFKSWNGRQVNIYVEPITDRTGRLIVMTAKKIFQRYFDGVSGGLYRFLASNDAGTIASVFEDSEDQEEYIHKHLAPIWDFFQESISGHLN